jgi:hypothetical protein
VAPPLVISIVLHNFYYKFFIIIRDCEWSFFAQTRLLPPTHRDSSAQSGKPPFTYVYPKKMRHYMLY